MATPNHVGTLRETSLHADLKRWVRQPGDRVEVPVDGFVVDVVRDELLIEIQTRGFSAMRRKLDRLVALGHRVRIVHPIPIRKQIVKIDDHHRELDRRRSPKRGQVTDVFAELTSFPQLVGAGVEIDVVLTHEEELRRFEPSRNRRRRGWRLVERRLVEVADVVSILGPDDLWSLIPDGLPDPFTTADLAAGVRRPRRLGQQIAYCLRHAGVIEPVGRQGNTIEYRAATT